MRSRSAGSSGISSATRSSAAVTSVSTRAARAAASSGTPRTSPTASICGPIWSRDRWSLMITTGMPESLSWSCTSSGPML